MVAQQEAPRGEVESREGLQEVEEGAQRKRRREELEMYRRKRKQYTTDSLLLSNHQVIKFCSQSNNSSRIVNHRYHYHSM